MIRYLALLLAAGAASGTAHAQTNVEARSVRIQFSHHQLLSANAMEAVRGRIARAARRVCASASLTVAEAAHSQLCRAEAIAGAEAQLQRVAMRVRLAQAALTEAGQ